MRLDNKKGLMLGVGIAIGAAFVIWAIPMSFKPSLLTLIYPRYIEKSFAQSSDPVYLPSGEYRQYSTFTSYSGWKNAYEVRFMDTESKTYTQFVDILQYSQNSITTSGFVKPFANKLDSFRAARTSKNCKIVDVAASIRLCDDTFLVRELTYGGKSIFSVAEYFHSDDEPFKENVSFKVLQSMQPIGLDTARKTYFKFEQYWPAG